MDQYSKNYNILHESNGDIFEGEIIQSGEQAIKHGVGKLITKTGNIFEGIWKQNQIDGICKIKYNNGDIYEGQFSNGKHNGVGVKFIVSSGERYEGQWVNGQMTGYGRFYFACDSSKVYTGQFYCGDFNGNGVLQTKDFIYRGLFENGEFDGFGRYEDLINYTIYEGNFNEGQRESFGKETQTIDNKTIEYEGNWKQGKKSGKGKQKIMSADPTEGSYIEGRWENNSLVEIFIQKDSSGKIIKELKQTSPTKIQGKINDRLDKHFI